MRSFCEVFQKIIFIIKKSKDYLGGINKVRTQ